MLRRIDPVHQSAALRCRNKAQKGVQRRGLPCTVAAEERIHAACGNAQVQRDERVFATPANGELARLKRRVLAHQKK